LRLGVGTLSFEESGLGILSFGVLGVGTLCIEESANIGKVIII
jgi:hypothetical protein